MNEDDFPDDLRKKSHVENWIVTARVLVYLFALSGLVGAIRIALTRECEVVDRMGNCGSEKFSVDNFANGFWIFAAVLLFVSFAMIILNYVQWKMSATSAQLLISAESSISLDDD